MRYIARGILVIAVCGMATSCTSPDGTGPDEVIGAGPQASAELIAEAAHRGEFGDDAMEDIMSAVEAPEREEVLSDYIDEAMRRVEDQEASETMFQAGLCATNARLGVPESGKRTWRASGRIWRNGRRSTCTNNKPCPGRYSSYTNYYDAWDFPGRGAPDCVTVYHRTVSNCSAYNTHPATVTGVYPTGRPWPSNCRPAPGVRYLGDSGSSGWTGVTVRYSFVLPAGTPFTQMAMNNYGAQTCRYFFDIDPCIEPPACQPFITGITPTSGSTDANRCGTTETFEIQFSNNTWIPGVRLDWRITAPNGGSINGLAEVSGSEILNRAVSSHTMGTFDLNRANCPESGTFQIYAVITNNCAPPEPNSEYSGGYDLVDDVPPVMGPRNDICLWPPNHLAFCQDVTDLRTATDNCGDDGIIGGAEVCASDQPDDSVGDGHTTGDCVLAIDDVGGQQIVCTRAERSGTIGAGNEGRMYTISGRYRDACGNFTPREVLQQVGVPHDQREHPECITPLEDL